jgi:hypothetical protein
VWRALADAAEFGDWFGVGRATVFRLNTSGWDEQILNKKKHVAAS